MTMTQERMKLRELVSASVNQWCSNRKPDGDTLSEQCCRLAQRLWDEDCYCLDNALVEAMFARDLATIDDCSNLYPSIDADDGEDAIEEAADRWGVTLDPQPTRKDAYSELRDRYGDDFDELTEGTIDSDLDTEHGEMIDQWCAESAEIIRDNADPQEPMQWFRVSEDIAGELDAIGQVVLSNEYGCWWGRTCCGQAALMDPTWHEIAARIMKRTGDPIDD